MEKKLRLFGLRGQKTAAWNTVAQPEILHHQLQWDSLLAAGGGVKGQGHLRDGAVATSLSKFQSISPTHNREAAAY